VKSFIESEGITYTVGLSTVALRAYGGGGIPHAYLVGPDGIVVWHGHPADLGTGEIEKVLRHTFHVREVAPELKPAATAFEKGKLAEARALALAVKEQGNRELVADADYLIGRIGDIVGAWKQSADNAATGGHYPDALDALNRIQQHYPGSDEATAAAAKVKELEADPLVQREMDAWKKLEKIQAEAQRAQGDKKKVAAAAKKLERFIAKYPSAKAAVRAQQLLESLKR
jgi:outer membrane protein assembly factor BamD (BamD/ComL family)